MIQRVDIPVIDPQRADAVEWIKKEKEKVTKRLRGAVRFTWWKQLELRQKKRMLGIYLTDLR